MNQQSGGNPNTTTCSNCGQPVPAGARFCMQDRKSTRLNSSHGYISYAVFCLKKKKINSETPGIDSTKIRVEMTRIHIQKTDTEHAQQIISATGCSANAVDTHELARNDSQRLA